MQPKFRVNLRLQMTQDFVYQFWVVHLAFTPHVMQANMAMKLLDGFRWTDARFRLIADIEPPDTSVRMNTGQLILTGVANVMPFDEVATHFAFTDEQRFAQVPGGEGPKLSAKDARLFQALRFRPTFSELMERSGMDMDATLRRLYAFCLLGLADFAETFGAEYGREAVMTS